MCRDPLFFVCDSPSHSDHQSQAVGDADKGTTHSNFMAGNWGCYKCSQRCASSQIKSNFWAEIKGSACSEDSSMHACISEAGCSAFAGM